MDPTNAATDSGDPPAAPTRALSGLRVIDLSRVLAGPFCTQMLADHGADVLKIEPPMGDETRTLGPPFQVSGDAAYFGAVNRGKRAIGLDLATEKGRDVLLRLLYVADVVVENFLPGTMERWGLGYESVLAPRFPWLIHCSISGFGADGPLGGLPGYDAVAQAIGGLMSVNGTPETGATRIGVPVVDLATGYNALVGILMALTERAHSGKGQKVEATLMDSAVGLLIPHLANWSVSGKVPGPLGSAHPNIAPYDKFRIGEREMILGVVNDGQFRRLCELIGRRDLPLDDRFATNAQRLANRDALRTELELAFVGRDADRLCAELMRGGVPAGPVNTVPQVFSHPHAAHRGMVLGQPAGSAAQIGVPIKLSRTPGQPGGASPAFGAHADAVMVAVGFTPAEIDALRAAGVLVDRRRSHGPPKDSPAAPAPPTVT